MSKSKVSAAVSRSIPKASSAASSLVGVPIARVPKTPALFAPVEPFPSSWPMKLWPTSVYPGTKRAAQRLLKLHLDELIELHAVARIGKDLVFLGLGWSQFLARRSSAVKGFKSGPMIGRERREAGDPANSASQAQ